MPFPEHSFIMECGVFKEHLVMRDAGTLTLAGGKVHDAAPRCSTDTLYNFDISSNLPRSILLMDAEDSPWGGM